MTGTTPDGRRALVIWRKLTGNAEQDNLVLDTWFTRAGYSAKDSEFGLILRQRRQQSGEPESGR